MELTIRVTSKDRNGAEVTAGDVVEFVDDRTNETVVARVESLDLGRIEFDPTKVNYMEREVVYFNLTNGDFAFAPPHLCTKVEPTAIEPTVEERIAAVVEDISLTTAERVGMILAIAQEA